MMHNSEHTRCYIKRSHTLILNFNLSSLAKRHIRRIEKKEQGVKEQFQAFKCISIIMFNNEADDAKRKSSFS